MVPVIETGRLVLRGWREDDFEDLAAIMADPEVMRFLGDGSTADRVQAWRSLAFLAGHWALKGYGHFVIEEKATGRLVGRTGLLNPEGWPELEIGWTLARAAWGKGYATEAGGAAMDWAFETLGLERLISLIHKDNAPSMRVAERLGESREKPIEFFGKPCFIYAISREGWLAARARRAAS
jgi:RimJ/RimL family protein N-acetyltransferase